jgi:tetratricopeptide (TPR) repeat protein
MGLKRMADALERLCDEGFDYWGRLYMTRGDYHRSRGEYDEAQACLEQALEAIREQERLTRSWIVVSLAEVHLAKENFELAAELARESLGWASDPKTIQVSVQIRSQRALALAEAAKGDVYQAERRLDRAIDLARSVQAAASIGLCHEARARVALMHEDHAGYFLHCAEANRWLRPTGNPTLVGVAERLVGADPNAHRSPDPEMVEASDSTTTVNKPETISTGVEQELRSDPNTVH